MKIKKMVITGGAGFIGSNLVNYLVPKYKDCKIWVIDKLSYSGRLDNIENDVKKASNFYFIRCDAGNRDKLKKILKNTDVVVHLAAETHVDRSILSIDPFVKNDFVVTANLLQEAMNAGVKKFIHISTSEVYGSSLYTPMDEVHPLNPQSPYAATKAGADRLVYSFYVTYKFPAVILRLFNNFGPRQYIEKLIPLFITNALLDEPLFIYGDGKNTRDWMFVEDGVKAIEKVIFTDKDLSGEVINFGTEKEKSVIEIAQIILEKLNKPKKLLKFIKDRPGHVKRLVCSYKKAQKILGWNPQYSFERGLELTIKWYVENRRWWEKRRKDKKFIEFYRRWYLNG